MFKLSGTFRSINHLWNDGRDIGVSEVDNPFTLLFVSDKEGFYRSSLTLSHHPYFCNFFPLILFFSPSFLFFSEMHLRHCLHSSVDRFKNWSTGEPLTACISQSGASVPCLPGRREETRLSSQQKKARSLNQLTWTMTNSRSFCLGQLLLTCKCKKQDFQTMLWISQTWATSSFTSQVLQ